MRKGLLLLAVIVLSLLFLAACQNQNGDMQANDNSDRDAPTDNMASDGYSGDNSIAQDASVGDSDAASYTEEAAYTDEGLTSTAAPSPDQEAFPDESTVASMNQMIIYRAEWSIEVPDAEATQAKLQQEAEARGGYVVEATLSQNDTYSNGHMVVRIPKDQFTAFLTELESASTRVVHSSTNGLDVSEEYVDLESHLTAQQAVETRLLSFMEDADSTDGLLAISRDLSQVQSEIERVKGRMSYLDNQIAYSTVTIDMTEDGIANVALQNTDELNTFARAQSLFIATINRIIDAGSGLFVLAVGLSPIVIPLLLVGIAIFVWYRRRPKTLPTNGEN